MRTELIGSFAIFIAYAFTRGWARPAIVITLSAAAFYFQQKAFLAFGAGALLRELWAAERLPSWPAPFALALGLLLGAPLQNAAWRFHVTNWPFLGDLGVTLGYTAIAGGALVVYAALASPFLRNLFAARAPAFLGRISFALYLVHAPLIFSLGAWLYVRAAPVSGFGLAIGYLALLALSLALAWAMTKGVDDPLVRALSWARKNYPRLMPRRLGTPDQG
jgi:peptidoglycan/LPS O-acetylase OafA/YrhL